MIRQVKIDIHRDIIEAAQAGRESAMHKLYELYAKAALNTAFRILNNVEDAEDMLQEAFISAFSSLHQFNYDSTFGAWFKRIVINKCLTLLKKRKTDLTVEFDEAVLNIVEPLEKENSQPYNLDELQHALHQLPTGYRTVLSLYLLEGYDHKEIGQILGIKESTSISQLSKAKRKIRQIIKKVNYGPIRKNFSGK